MEQCPSITQDMDRSESKDAVSISPSSSFPFLDLPAEIRNQIYELVLTNRAPVVTGPYRQWSPKNATSSSICVALLRVSRKVHEESSTTLYSINRYQAHPQYLIALPFLLEASRPLTSPAYISLIRKYHISVRLDCDPYWSRSALCTAFSGLEELIVEASQSSYGTTGYRALESFVDVRRVKHARVEGCVAWEFARWLETVMQSTDEHQSPDPCVGGFWDVWQDGNR